MSYHYFGSSLPERVISSVSAQAGRTGGQIASTVKSGVQATGRLLEKTPPFQAYKSLTDATRAAKKAAQAAEAKTKDAIKLIKESRKKLEETKKMFKKYQLTGVHWSKINELESKVNKAINMLPLTSKLELIRESSKLLDFAVIAIALALTGSTLLLWLFYGREPGKEQKKKKKKQKRKSQKKYIEIAEGREIPEGYEIV